jgi:hypothetical protein
MTFQFTCPAGHLLEGELSQAGQPCQCPECGAPFEIPQPAPAPARSRPPAGPGLAAAPEVYADFPGGSSGGEFDAGGFDAGGGLDAASELDVVHIPCPNGHVLETPRDMIGQDVLCPQCQAQFRLRETHSLEYRRRKEAEDDRIARRRGKLWLNWAIVAAVVVGLSLIGMVIMIANP